MKKTILSTIFLTFFIVVSTYAQKGDRVRIQHNETNKYWTVQQDDRSSVELSSILDDKRSTFTMIQTGNIVQFKDHKEKYLQATRRGQTWNLYANGDQNSANTKFKLGGVSKARVFSLASDPSFAVCTNNSYLGLKESYNSEDFVFTIIGVDRKVDGQIRGRLTGDGHDYWLYLQTSGKDKAGTSDEIWISINDEKFQRVYYEKGGLLKSKETRVNLGKRYDLPTTFKLRIRRKKSRRDANEPGNCWVVERVALTNAWWPHEDRGWTRLNMKLCDKPGETWETGNIAAHNARR